MRGLPDGRYKNSIVHDRGTHWEIEDGNGGTIRETKENKAMEGKQYFYDKTEGLIIYHNFDGKTVRRQDLFKDWERRGKPIKEFTDSLVNNEFDDLTVTEVSRPRTRLEELSEIMRGSTDEFEREYHRVMTKGD